MSLVKEEVLLPEYLPPLLPHRETHVKQLADNLLPAAQGRKPQNTFLYGAPGLGKTAVLKFVFREFEEFSSSVKTVYINCWDFRTAHATLVRVATQFGIFVPRKGWGKDEVLQKIVEALKKSKLALILGLDEVDQLDREALYHWLRLNQYVENPVGLVLVSNHPETFLFKEPRIRSSLGLEEIEFRPYSLSEMKDILKQRATHAFRDYEPAAILLAASHAVQKGSDVRVGLECLLRAGRIAEKENANKLKVEHVKKVLKEVKEVKPKLIEQKLSSKEKIIIDILKEGELTSGELYKKFLERSEEEIAG